MLVCLLAFEGAAARPARPAQPAAECRVSTSLSLTAAKLANVVIEESGDGFSVEITAPGGRTVWSVPRSWIDGPTATTFYAEEPGDYRIVLTKRHCDDDVHAAVRATQRSLSTETAALRVALEKRFLEAEETRLRYEEPHSRSALEAFEAIASEAALARVFDLAARAKHRRGMVFDALGELESVPDALSEALLFAERADDSELRATISSALGVAQTYLGRADEGAHRCREALEASRSAGSRRGEAEALLCLGEVSYHRGDLRASLATQEEVLGLARSAGSRWLEGRALLLAAYSQSDLSELEPAKANYLASLEIWRRLGERRLQALTLVALGRLSLRLGDNRSAVERFEEALALVELMGDDVWKGSILAGFGELAFNMGLPARAAVYYEDSLRLMRSAGLRVAELESLLSVGEGLLLSGKSDEALARFTEALALSRELDIPRWASLSLVSIGTVHHRSGAPVDALRFYQLALLEMPEDALRYRALTWNALGAVYRDLGRTDAAVEAFERALELSRASLDPFQEASSRYYLARAAASKGDLSEAREQLDRAITLAESLRGRVLSRELRSSFLAAVRDYYELYVDVLMRSGGEGASVIGEAFRIAELARARSLLDSLAESRVDVTQGVDEGLLARETRVRELYNAKALREMELRERGGEEAELGRLKDEMALLAAEYDRVQSQIRSTSPNFASLTQPEPETLSRVQRDVLDEETVLLEYTLGKARSYLWVVTEDEAVPFTLPPRDAIEGLARTFYELLTTRQRRSDESPREWRMKLAAADAATALAAAELGRILLGPARERLAGRRRVVVAAEGALLYVPFGALPSTDSAEPNGSDVPMIATHEIVRAPSASVLAALRRGAEGRGGATPKIAIFADPVFGTDDARSPERASPGPARRDTSGFLGTEEALPLSLPRLPATRLEATAIESLAPADSVLVALGLDATRELVLGPELRGYDIVHFATHAVLNDESPELSGVALSLVDETGSPRDGFLRLHDIYNLSLPAELVVLSACNTALGKPIRGEGLVGLVRGFLYAGARSVVASLWKVEDVATTELMTRFYRLLLRESSDAAAALRAAQNSLRQDGRFGPPFYWAAFELHGDWR